MLIQDSPERIVIQEGPGWASGLGGVLIVIGVMVFAAAVGILSGMKWKESWIREASFWASLGAISLGTLLALWKRGWILELDRVEKKVTLRRTSPFSPAKVQFTFEEMEGARVVATPGKRARLEILANTGLPSQVIYGLEADEAICIRAKEKIEKALKEPPPNLGQWNPKVRMRM